MITVPIIPKAQARDRIGVMKNGRAMSYKAKTQKQAEKDLGMFLMQHIPDEPIPGAILLGVKAFLPIPKSMPKYRQVLARAGDLRPTTKPDLDNLIKNVKDVMTTLQFWRDDNQVVGFLEDTGKYYAERPRWEIQIVKLG